MAESELSIVWPEASECGLDLSLERKAESPRSIWRQFGLISTIYDVRMSIMSDRDRVRTTELRALPLVDVDPSAVEYLDPGIRSICDVHSAVCIDCDSMG